MLVHLLHAETTNFEIRHLLYFSSLTHSVTVFVDYFYNNVHPMLDLRDNQGRGLKCDFKRALEKARSNVHEGISVPHRLEEVKNIVNVKISYMVPVH